MDRLDATESASAGQLAGLRLVLALIDELLGSVSTDALCRAAVILLRERLGVERCSLWLTDGEVARGTFGVDGRGGVSDERRQHLRVGDDYGGQSWLVTEAERCEFVDGALCSLGRGWVARTPVLSGARVVGVLVNDAALSGSDLNPALQEALAAFCAHLGPLVEQKRVDEALAAREQQLRLVLDGGNFAYWDLDLVTGQSTFSAAFAAMLGYEPRHGQDGMALGEWMAYVHPDDQPLFAAAIDRHLAGHDERVSLVLRCMSSDRGQVWAEVRGKVVSRDEAGRARRLAGTLRDVTREEQAQQALAASERRLRAMVTALPDVVLVVGADGRLREPPTGSETAMPMVSSVAPLYSSLPPGPAREFREALEATLASGEPRVVNLPWRHGAKTMWFEARLARLTADQAIVVAREITTRRQLEDQLRQVSKMEAVGVLAGGVAHEFNNLLTTIMGNAELLMAEAPAGHRNEAGLQQIVDACQRAAELTQQLLGVGRKQMRRPSLLDLRHLLLHQRERIEAILGDQIELYMDLPQGSVPVMADEPQLALVLASLAANARDAMPNGGQVSMTAGVVGDRAQLQVIDTGCGMAPDLLERIFEPFFTTKGLGHGRGMSLAVVDGVVAQHGGSILVHSRVGQGSCFEVNLPLAAEPQPDRRDDVESLGCVAGAGDPPRTILLVEDDSELRLVADRVLVEQGYRVVSWSEPTQAVQWASDAQVDIDLLVVDARLPGLSGMELADLLRRQRPTLPVLVITDPSSPERPDRSIDSGVQRALSRGFTSQELGRAVSEMLSTTTR